MSSTLKTTKTNDNKQKKKTNVEWRAGSKPSPWFTPEQLAKRGVFKKNVGDQQVNL